MPRSSETLPSSFSLSRTDTAVLKALAMIFIVTHNFMHLVTPAPSENEFAFYSAEGIWRALTICFVYPGEIPHVVFSFFGHYGVVAFVFLSGYGLTRKLITTSTGDGHLRVARQVAGKQILKMIQLIAVGAAFVLAWRFATEGGGFSLDSEFGALLKLLTFTNNLRPDSLWGFVSVWWFFALIAQLYVLFPLFVRGLQRCPTTTIGAGVAALGAAEVFGPVCHGVVLYATPLSHSIIFLTGMWLAKGNALPERIFSWSWCVFLLAQFVPLLFPLSFLAVLFCALDLWRRYGNRLSANRPLVWFGGLSSFVFLVHGWMRHPVVDWLDQVQRTQFAANGSFHTGLTWAVFVGWFIAVVGMAWESRALYRFLSHVRH